MKVPEADKAGFDNRIYVIGETKLCIRLRTTSAGERQFPRILTGSESLSHLCLSLAPKTMNSVLSGFSLSLFSDIQT